MPIYSKSTLDIKEIFAICVNRDVAKEWICTQRPLRVKENATFIVDQAKCGIKHPFDLQADNIGGAYRKSDMVRFYECTRNCDGTCSLSSEVHVVKNNGKVVSGVVNEFIYGKWEKRQADLKLVYALVRKRADHVQSKKTGTNFSRQIVFTMPLADYNSHYPNLSKSPIYHLTQNLIILSYQTSQVERDDEELPVFEEAPHRNSKSPFPTIFRPIEHSAKKVIEKDMQHSTTAPRLMLQEIERNNDSIFTESTTTPNIKQVYNYRQKSKENSDPYLEILRKLLDQEKNSCGQFNVTDYSQPFVREVTNNTFSFIMYVTYTV